MFIKLSRFVGLYEAHPKIRIYSFFLLLWS